MFRSIKVGSDFAIENVGTFERNVIVLPAAIFIKSFSSSRAPLLAWPREWPVEGEPAGVVEIVDAYGSWLSTSTVPKLFVNADPGSTLVDRLKLEACTPPTWQTETQSRP